MKSELSCLKINYHLKLCSEQTKYCQLLNVFYVLHRSVVPLLAKD